MGILEQIKEMKNKGMPDDQIVTNLREQGISPRQINDALSQSQIKQAVSNEEYSPQNPPMPNQQEYSPQNTNQYNQYNEQEYPQQQNYSQPQEYYQQEEQYGYPSGVDSDTIIEISEQVFSEKIKKIQKQVEEITEFKSLAETKIENIDNRLKRIETTIDKLQIAILEKIGSYGNNIESIKKEMSMMQDSFGKIVNHAVKNKKSSPKEKFKKKSSKS